MPDYHDEFFDEQKPWSRLKNRILGSYMPPYMAKVAKLGKRIIIVDAFAGPGRFNDRTAGSPLIIAEAAEKFAAGKYDAYFFNNRESHHNLLAGFLERQGISAAKPVFGDAIEQLADLIARLRDETLFLYIDPYGLDCEYDLLRPLLERPKRHSTEIMINLHMPISHRLGSRYTVQRDGVEDPKIRRYHEKLTRVYGGNYWWDILIEGQYANAKKREEALINHYRGMLTSTGYLSYSGACPIREKTDSATKYFMVFASPHPDALLLLNDEMCKSFNAHMHNQEVKDTLFADSSWTEWRNPDRMRDIALRYVRVFPRESRLELWRRIVGDHFMLFTKSEFGKAMKHLCDTGEIECITPVIKGGTRPTKRLNDNCAFVPSTKPRMF